MPTPDASQFTQLKKYSAVAGIDTQGQGQKRTVTRTTQPLPSVLRPLNFLPSFSNKYTTGTNFVPINRVTGLQAKTKVPGGHVFGDSAGAGGGGGGTDAVMRQAIINLSDFTAGPAGTYSYDIDIATNFSNAGPDIQNTSTVTNSTINPLSSFIVNFKDKSYVTGRKYAFSTSQSSENSEMDIYIGKTGVSLTTTDVVSCVNNNITFEYISPSPLTQNIVSTWISGGAGGGHEKFIVEDFQFATDFVNIVAMKYISQDYSGYSLTVKVTDTPQ